MSLWLGAAGHPVATRLVCVCVCVLLPTGGGEVEGEAADHPRRSTSPPGAECQWRDGPRASQVLPCLRWCMQQVPQVLHSPLADMRIEWLQQLFPRPPDSPTARYRCLLPSPLSPPSHHPPGSSFPPTDRQSVPAASPGGLAGSPSLLLSEATPRRHSCLHPLTAAPCEPLPLSRAVLSENTILSLTPHALSSCLAYSNWSPAEMTSFAES